MEKEKLVELASLALEAALQAGKKILEVYNRTFDVDYKSDGSPLTEADHASHMIILKALEESGLPLLSEEGKETPYDTRRSWKYYWLVDPLDGTKEFIKRNGEFTVNIALMETDQPVIGIIYQPGSRHAYAGIVGNGLFKIPVEGDHSLSKDKLLMSPMNENASVRVIASRTHGSTETDKFIDNLRGKSKSIDLVNAGSSLKFCLLAEGTADVYPRFAPTMEWDTAAGHALLKSCGKNIYLYPGGTEMTYNKKQLVNEWFIAR